MSSGTPQQLLPCNKTIIIPQYSGIFRPRDARGHHRFVGPLEIKVDRQESEARLLLPSRVAREPPAIHPARKFDVRPGLVRVPGKRKAAGPKPEK